MVTGDNAKIPPTEGVKPEDLTIEYKEQASPDNSGSSSESKKDDEISIWALSKALSRLFPAYQITRFLKETADQEGGKEAIRLSANTTALATSLFFENSHPAKRVLETAMKTPLARLLVPGATKEEVEITKELVRSGEVAVGKFFGDEDPASKIDIDLLTENEWKYVTQARLDWGKVKDPVQLVKSAVKNSVDSYKDDVNLVKEGMKAKWQRIKDTISNKPEGKN